LIDEAPATRLSLLLRLRDPQDAEAWRQFVQVYAAVVYGFARKRGLQDADAADLMQDVFRSVAAAAGRLQYDRTRGTFRAWLYTVTRNKLYNFLTGRRRREHASGDSDGRALLEAHPAPPDGAAEWDQEYERRVFAWAAERVRGEFSDPTWQAFWQTAVDNVAAKDVGSRLGMSPGAVYVAKSRVLARLREEIQQLQQE
jgi:RNA polymerase sigma-70 factor (ECF subfamily)